MQRILHILKGNIVEITEEVDILVKDINLKIFFLNHIIRIAEELYIVQRAATLTFLKAAFQNSRVKLSTTKK